MAARRKMTKGAEKPAREAAAKASSGKSAATQRSRSPRVARKQAAARAKILAAAERLMREGPVEDVTINDITRAADVGHGSFYLHFESKNAVLIPIAQAHAASMVARLDRLTADEPDAAKVVGVSARHMIRAVVADPLWSWFIFKSGLPLDRLREGMEVSAIRDIARGIEAGRFVAFSDEVLSAVAAGTMVGILGDLLAGRLTESDIDLGVAHLLMGLGVPAADAEAIALSPLPPLPDPEPVPPPESE